MLDGPQHGTMRPENFGYRRGVDREKAKSPAVGRREISYRELVERVPIVLYVDASDEVSSAVYMSPQSESLLGYSRGEWLEDPDLWVKLLHSEDRERVLEEHARARDTGEPFEAEYRLVHRNGGTIWVRDEAAVVVGERPPERRAGALSDITERKRYERRLRKSEERFRLMAKATGEAIWDNDLVSGAQEWDGATEALFGYPPRQGTTGAWWEERLHPEDKERVIGGLDELLGGDGEVWEQEYRFRRADGTYAEVVDRGYLVRGRNGEPVRMVGAMKDVTYNRRVEEELRKSEERYRAAFERAPVPMAHLTPDGRFLRVNESFLKLSGYGRAELLEMTWRDVTPPGDLEARLDRVRRALGNGPDAYSVERRYIRKDGSNVWLDLSVSLMREASGAPDSFICVANDITERKLGELLPHPLTPRELEVMERIAVGRSNPQIATDLAHSLGTVKQDVRSVLTKLGVRDRTEAVARAVEIGLLPSRSSEAS